LKKKIDSDIRSPWSVEKTTWKTGIKGKEMGSGAKEIMAEGKH